MRRAPAIAPLLSSAAAGLMLTMGGSGQEKTPAPFVESVEVRVRSVLVFITDGKGKPLSTPPKPADLRVVEGGSPAEVVAIEPARLAGAAGREALPPAAASAPGRATPAPKLSGVPQYVYLDTASLQVRSVPRIVDTLQKNLGAMLANGPIEIVVADPEPKVLLRSTSDAAAIRASLASLPKQAVGKGRMRRVRADTLERMNSSLAENRAVVADVRGAVREELSLLQISLESLESWAASLPPDQAAIVYLCNDGFDADATEIYRHWLMSSANLSDSQHASQLQLEFGREVPKLVERTSRMLAGRGLTTVPLAFGGSEADFANSAANLGKVASNSIHRALDATPVSYYARPFEPLVTIADLTGGKVISAESKFPGALDELGGAYLVSFRSHAPGDGQPHPLEIASASGNLRVRGPRSVLAGVPGGASARRTVEALAAPPAPGLLTVAAFVAPIEKMSGGRTKGQLTVSADLAPIAEALERVGPGRIRVTVAVQSSTGAPFIRNGNEEMDLVRSGEGTVWYYEAEFTWPPDATRVAVTVEELKTGASGTSVAELAPLP